VTVGSKPVCLVVLPLAIIDITVCMNQSAFTIGLIVSPVSLVHGTVGPDLNALALTNVRATEPLALVLRTVFEDLHLADLTLAQSLLMREVIIVEWT